jgi:hypothetical protein
MKTKLYILLLLISATSKIYCQESNYTISGFVIDSLTNLPIQKANIFTLDKKSGTTSDEKGFFSLNIDKPSKKLVVSHISYKEVEINLSNGITKNVKIKLEPLTQNLTEVSISAFKVINILKDKSLFVLDYEFIDSNIICIAYPKYCFYKPTLILMNIKGDSITSIPVFKPKELYKDCFGRCNFVSKNYTMQIVITEKGDLKLVNPVETEKFYAAFNPLIDINNNFYYLKIHTERNQQINYICYNEADSSYNRFRIIRNEEAVKRNYWGAYFDGTESDIRFAEMIMNKPVYAPLFRDDDTIIIMNFNNSAIEFYNQKGDFIKEHPITFQNDKNWKEEVYYDAIFHKFYSTFKNDGITTLKEFDDKSGKIINSTKIPDFVFIEKIKVNAGYIYFLYKEKINEEYKKIYKMKI